MPVLLLIVALLAVIIVYILLIRPRQLTWGATEAEVSQTLTGDDIVQKPHMVATRAITIDTLPDDVWPWLIQIGSARAGFYSIDLLDNGNVPSSREILPEFQKIEPDYFVPFTPDQKNGMWVKDFRAPDFMLWWDRKGNATWGWFLQPTANGGTRLLTRLRTRYDLSFPWVIYYLIYDFGDIVMMSKCMRGIKERAETLEKKPRVQPTSQPETA